MDCILVYTSINIADKERVSFLREGVLTPDAG
jgi:hypothetical protein